MNEECLLHSSQTTPLLLSKVEKDLLPPQRVGKLIINSHLENRDYPQQEMTGMFMNNYILNYVTYKENNI
uniref:Uncharacterized protein n=1 Tax=Brassica oleracea var. oleracea TaxID=109376 RepID=A0A0D3DL06_BRAOL